MMASSLPKISAIVTTKDRSELLKRALSSVVVQSYKNLELIIVDDGSTDDTEEVIKEFEDRIDLTYLKNRTSRGACAARNRGIKAAKGKFIAGLDDDDMWHPKRIEKLYHNYFEKYAFITSDVLIVNDSNNYVWGKKKILSLDDLLYSNQVGNQVLVERERVLEVGGFDEKLTAAQDYDLWIRLSEKFGDVINLKEPLQTVFEEESRERITTSSSIKLDGYLSFYNKHKSKMSKSQRKYQLYLLRRKLYKPLGVKEFVIFVPISKFWKEMKRFLYPRIKKTQ